MKRSILFAAAVVLLGACSTKEIDFQTPVQNDVVFYASFEQPTDIDTKVYANEDLLLRWTADDRVSIFNTNTYNQQYAFAGETGDNAGGFRKVESDEFMTGNDISHVVSVYPYQTTTKITESEIITVNLPTEQHYAENTFGLGANTMVSVTSDNFLQYKNVGGYLMLKLYGKGVSVSSITLKGNNGEKLAGKASVTMPLDGMPTAVMADDATTEITLICESPIQLGATAEESTQFWFVVPPMTFEKGFTITVKGAAAGTFEKSTSKSIAIERNKLSKMAFLEVEMDDIDDSISLSDTENANCYIVSATGNYSFDASIIGNGDKGIIDGYCHTSSAHIEPKKVILLWQDSDIISNLSLKDGRVAFSASENKGNALIAVCDEDDIILWSWHIWATDLPDKIQLTPSTHSFLDRNLGAISCEPGQTSAIGLYYQWGRKDPLHPQFSQVSEAPNPLTIEYLINNPTVAVLSNSSRWVEVESGSYNVGLWGNPEGSISVATRKSIYDPCPIGYTIPADDTWYEYGQTSSTHRYYSLYDSSIMISNVEGGIIASKSGVSIYYPIVSPLYSETTSSIGLYFRNGLYENQGLASCAGFGDGYVSPNMGSQPDNRLLIRCIKEESYPVFPPVVETKSPEDIKVNDVVLVGAVTNSGNSLVTQVGFVWGLSQSAMNNRVLVQNSQNGFKIRINDLPSHSTIYYKAFAENASGISYGNTMIVSLFSVTDYTKLQIDSLSRLMTTQYCRTQGMNGEGTIRLWYGDYPGNTMSSDLSGWQDIINSENLTNTSSSYAKYPLLYYYGLINRVNRVLDNFVVLADEYDPNINHYEAELLGYRAYAYMMLVQLYCKSWSDSGNGSSAGLPLRIGLGEDIVSLSSLLSVYNQIYADLDKAISIMTSSNVTRSDVNEIDLQTLYAIYAKAALNRKDYSKAKYYAKLARTNHNLMSNDDYYSGFNISNSEWIWGAHPGNLSVNDIQLYYYSFFSYMGSNSQSSAARVHPKCISMELFNRIPDSDIRKSLFLNSNGYSYDSTGKADNTYRTYVLNNYSSFLYSTSFVFAFMQFKFRVLFQPGGGQMNFIRSSEMVLIEAEAAFFLGLENETRSLLEYLNYSSGRDASYQCNKSGDALLDEIKFYRRVELWGEGFDWFDVKRWGDPISRKSFSDGGNFLDVFSGTWYSRDKNDFVWVLPDDYETIVRATSTVFP